jgi:quercetin dioxygenase-like cupin family protein
MRWVQLGRRQVEAIAGGATLQVLDGRLHVQADGREPTVEQGDLVAFGDNLRGPIGADEDTAIVVTVAWPEGTGAWDQEARSGHL